MKRFLTREQTEMLKEALTDRYKYLPPKTQLEENAGVSEVYVCPGDVEDILDEYTEQPFPELNCEIEGVGLSIDLHLDKYVKIWLEYGEPTFSFKTFKWIVTQMQEMVCWIEGNE